MLWVTWRHQFSVALGGVAVFLGVLTVWLWTTGLSVHHAYDATVACRPVGSAKLNNLAIDFESTNSFLKGGFVLQRIPALIGAFIGPVVLAREFETGTFRYAWTQAFGRWRWALAKLVLLGVAVASLAAASVCCCPGTTSPTSPRRAPPTSPGRALLGRAVRPARPRVIG